MTHIAQGWPVSTDHHETDTSALANLSALTPAEQAVLDEALTGAPARQIAERLTLSEATVRSHLSRIYVKLGVSGRVALLAAFREAEAPDEARGSPPAGRSQPIGPTVRPTELTIGVAAWAAIGAALVGIGVALTALALLDEGTAVAPMALAVVVLLAAMAGAIGRRLWSAPTRPNVVRSAAAAVVVAIVGFVLLTDAAGEAVVQQAIGLGLAALALVAGLVPLRAWERLGS